MNLESKRVLIFGINILTIIPKNNIIIMYILFSIKGLKRMNYYNIAGLNVKMHFGGKTLTKQAKPYEILDIPEKIDIEINPTVEIMMALHDAHPYSTMDICEYMWTGTEFYQKLLDFDGFMLHSSAVVLDGVAYLFSAKSGTGKSTHTGLWLKVFSERARILNDDKPAIRLIDGKVYASGTPWSGKVDLSVNESVPLQGICFLERSEDNHISKISTKEAISLILEQTIRSNDINVLDKLLTCMEKVLRNVNVYKLGCNMTEEAVWTSYNAMKGL